MTYTTYVTLGSTKFPAANIRAVKKAGTLKQIVGKRIVQRQIPQRDIWDWDITIDGVYEGTETEIDAFKETIYGLFGSAFAFEDGNSNHTGSYLLEPSSVEFDEAPDYYEGGAVKFRLSIVQFNQTSNT